MHILVINAGSSSVKFSLFSLPATERVLQGKIERIGTDSASLSWQAGSAGPWSVPCQVSETGQAISRIAALLKDREKGGIGSLEGVQAVGHRVVHGGDEVHGAVRVTAETKDLVRRYSELAPLHNPMNLLGIEACELEFPQAVQAAVFDTAFHATLPEHAFLYGLPWEFYRDCGIRKFGFHGTSHCYAARTAARCLDRPLEEVRIITCHLGNGSSVTAVEKGVSVDTSMGFTPLEGLIMGTRCGDIDPAVIHYLHSRKGLPMSQIHELLNNKGGLLGLAGIGSSDIRDIEAASLAGNSRAGSALRAFFHRIRKYIGAYTAVMGGLDALVFTGGIGENSPMVREAVCLGFEGGGRADTFLPGVGLDLEANSSCSGSCSAIHSSGSHFAVLVIPADEETEIASQVFNLLEK
jgi:acetate kinase